MKMLMNKSKKHFIKSLCVCLAFCCTILGCIQLMAKAFEPTIYVDDVKIYECNADDDADADAKAFFEGIGYVYTGIDLNNGADNKRCAYLGYKTTTNRDMAITDIRMMAMDTGYELYNYQDMVNYLASQKAGTAQAMYVASVVFIDNYLAGSPRAIDVYNALNLYDIGDTARTRLGDYIVSGQADLKFFTDILVKSSTGTMNAVHSYLSMALTPFENDLDDETNDIITTSWAGFTVKSDLWEIIEDENITTDEVNELHKNYNDRAREVFKAIQDFVTLYENALARQNHVEQQEELPEANNIEEAADAIEEVDREDTDFLYLSAMEMLNEYSFADGSKLGDWFLDIGKKTSDTVNLMQLYPVVEAMGEAQAAIVRTGGFVSAVLNLAENQHSEDIDSAVQEAKKTINKYRKVDSVSIWENCDDEIENSTIAFTSDSVRKSSAENSLGKKSKWQTFKEDFEEIQKVLGIVTGVLFTVIPVMVWVLSAAVVITKIMAATCIAMAALNTLCVGLLAVASFLNACLPWIGIFVTLFTVGMMIGIAIKEAIKGKEVDIDKQSDKPDFIFDAKEVGTEVLDVKYKSVRNSSGKVSDINVEKQIKWVLLAYSKDTRIGSPICADENGIIFKCVTGNSGFQNGYDCVKFFGERSPADCNAHCFENKTSGVYLHYRTEASIASENQTPNTTPKPDESGEKPKEEKNYISDILICTGKNASDAKSKIVKHEGKFYVLDYNLSPDQEFATYIGYSMTTNPEQAITDLRVAPYMGVSQQTANVMYGDIKYTRIDIMGYNVEVGDEQTKPQANALYYTKDKNAGEPILADGLHPVTSYSSAKDGWEPISLFGNDIPYNFDTRLASYSEYSGMINFYECKESFGMNNVRCVYVYFESDKTYTDGTKYLSGVFFYGGFEWEDTAMLRGDVEIRAGEYTERLGSYPKSILHPANIANAVFEEEHISWLHVNSFIGFTYTYNPKRALYNVEAYQGDSFSLSLNYSMSKINDLGLSQNYVACSFFNQQASCYYTSNIRFIDKTNTFMNANGMIHSDGDLLHHILDGCTHTLPEGIEFGYSRTNYLPANLYVTGYQKDAKPLTLADVVISDTKYTATETDGRLSVDISNEKTLAGTPATGAFHGVTDMKNPRSKNPFAIGYSDFYKDAKDDTKVKREGSIRYLYLSGSRLGKRKYISSLSVGAFSREQYKTDNPNASEDELKSIDRMVEGTAMAQATCGCADEVIVVNCATDNQSDAWYNKQKDKKSDRTPPENKPAAYIGVSRTDVGTVLSDEDGKTKAANNQRPITGVLLYKLDDKTAPGEITIDSIRYYCAGVQTPIVMKGTKYFLYYTYSRGAIPGEPIEEIKIDNIPIIAGYSTNLCADKNSQKPYGNADQTNFIHVKIQRDTRKDFYNKLYIGQGANTRAALCDLLSQGCLEYVDLDLNTGRDGKAIYLGYRTGHIDEDKIKEMRTESGREKERAKQLQEAVYDVVVTNDEPYHSEGIVCNNVYYKPVSSVDLTGGSGHKLYMYYACPWYSSRYNANNTVATLLPQNVFTGYYVNMALGQYDRVPYKTELNATTNTQNGITPWEYVMFSDNSSQCDFNVGNIAFDRSKAYYHHAVDNRITMFAQRSDGSVKPAGEITGGFVGKTMGVGTGYVEN